MTGWRRSSDTDLVKSPPRRASARPAAWRSSPRNRPCARGSPRPPRAAPWRRSSRSPSLASTLRISACALLDLAHQAGALGAHVDDAGERQGGRRLAQHDLRRALRRAPWRTRWRRGAPAARWSRRDARRARACALPAPTSTSGILAPAGTFISERTERTSLTSFDQPADLLVGVGIGQALEHRPGREAQQVLALDADLDQPRPTAPR